MKEAYKLIVSYAEGDNQSAEGELGWADDFCKFLEIFANRLSKQAVKVVKLKDANGKESDPHAIGVAVLSSAYLKSADQQKELKQLIQVSSICYRVQKQPVSSIELPAELSSEIAYKFYERSIEAESGYIEYNSKALNKNYWLKLVDLAYDITQKIVNKEHEKTSQKGKTVYLAETTFDQENNRDTLRRELQRYGHTVLPDHPLPNDASKLKNAMEEYLSKCDVAIHMVGAHYGKSVNGTDISLVEYQNQIAGQYAESKYQGDGTFIKRYLWSPPYMKPADEKQMLYLDRLKEEIDKATNAEIIQVPLEILKTIVEKNLIVYKNSIVNRDDMNSSENGQTAVYLIYDKNDEKDVESLKSKLEKEKIKVFTPSFKGNQLDLLHQHRANLIDADAVFIYSNTSNQFWLNSKVNDLIKSPGFGRTKPYKVQAICVPNAKASTDGYKEFSDIVAIEKLNEESINSFLVKLK